MERLSGLLRKQVPWIVVAIYIACFVWLKNPANPWNRIINSDGKGYYAYLPALFIYHDLSFSFIDSYEQEYYPKGGDLYKDFRVAVGEGVANKYFPGLAVLWLPFFLIGHILAMLLNFPTDGYSMPYQLAIAFSAFVYMFFGLRLLQKILRHYSRNETINSWVVLLAGLATNLIYYTVVEGSMVHVYDFFMVNAFILLILNAVEKPGTLNFTLAAAVFALIVITRPQNGLLIFAVPFLAGGWDRLKELIRSFFGRPKIWATSILASCVIVSIPLIIWVLQTGKFFVYTYGNEHFDLLNPHTYKFLLGFEKGWLIYTPAATLSLFGFVPLYKHKRFSFFALAGFLALLIYVLSSWWAWNYTSQHSQRVMIDFLAFFAILLVFLFGNVKPGKESVWTSLLFTALILLNFLQLYQQKIWVYPKGEVTASSYFSKFFSLKPSGTYFIPKDKIAKKQLFNTDFEEVTPFFRQQNIKELPDAFSGKHALTVDTANPTLIFSRSMAGERNENPVLLKIGGMFLQKDETDELKVIVKYGHSNDYYGQNDLMFSRTLRPAAWTYAEYVSYIPYIQSVNDSVFIEFVAGGKASFADNLVIEFITMKAGPKLDWFGKPPEVIDNSIVTKCDMDHEPLKGWKNTNKAVAGDAFSGDKSCILNITAPYSIMFEDSLASYFGNKDGYIRVAARVKSGVTSKPLLVFDYRKGLKTVKYSAIPLPINDMTGTWSLVEMFNELPVEKPDLVRIYFWYTAGNEPVNIDDFTVEFVSYLPKKVVHQPEISSEKISKSIGTTCFDFENPRDFSSGKISGFSGAPSGGHVTRFNGKDRFSYAMKVPVPVANKKIGGVSVTAELYSDCMYSNAALVADFRLNGKSAGYNPLYLKGINEKGKWIKLVHEAVLPENKMADTVLVYFYLPHGDEQLMADDVCVRLLPLHAGSDLRTK